MSQWRVIDFTSPDDLPWQGREIYFSMAEGEGKPFSQTGRMKADLNLFRDILARQPGIIIIWRPCPRPPVPPVNYSLVRRMKCNGTEYEKRRCIYWENNDVCLQDDLQEGDEDYCGKQRPRLEIFSREVDDQ